MDEIKRGSGREGRIVDEYLKRRDRLDTWPYGYTKEDVNEIWLDMARKYKCKVRELKDILNAYKAAKREARLARSKR
jgi:hypothetical protein